MVRRRRRRRFRVTQRVGADESGRKPDSVPGAPCGGRVAAIHLGLPSPAGSSDLPAGIGRATLERLRRNRTAAPFWPCSGWGLPSRPGRPGRWWSLTPPFHPYPIARAVCSLWHCPAGRPGLPLATTLPCGVRTFLDRFERAGRGRPADSSALTSVSARPSGSDGWCRSRAAPTPCHPGRTRRPTATRGQGAAETAPTARRPGRSAAAS